MLQIGAWAWGKRVAGHAQGNRMRVRVRGRHMHIGITVGLSFAIVYVFVHVYRMGVHFALHIAGALSLQSAEWPIYIK